ncbi:multicomponent Na+:H+ antiporter subunit G [Devosia subaequoris]|uniref:Multicomponent Na+:H+ antiporter subunit G n=1 Tax=Devosia subaequoris TaxID=395930 RepID=A0A7W6IK51_9HYPH|nr:monovalent cation/H(+) antiporter subunit G [Devosia subaequoris]MBB4051083.1 multicomponent Na+:H+ antiporter subunit G [Devosia subaequoris]MCP1208251.1 monovalent cation/H(+) antiporter subunit G [Devosia subaequoris]
MLEGVELYLGGTLLVLGAAFTLLAAIGVVRLPDLYTRMHAASKAGAVGGGLILLAVAVLSQDAAVSVRAIIGVMFVLLTTPVAAHLLARASYLTGYRPCNDTVIDDIAQSNE